MYCENCGNNIPDNVNFCPKCGQNVKTNDFNKNDNKPSDNKKLLTIGIVTSIITFLLGFFNICGSLIFLLGLIPLIIYFAKKIKKIKLAETNSKIYKDANEKLQADLEELQTKSKNTIAEIQAAHNALESRFNELGFNTFDETMSAIENEKAKANAELQLINEQIVEANSVKNDIIKYNASLTHQTEKLEKQFNTAARKLEKERELYTAVNYAVSAYFEYNPSFINCKLPIYTEEQLNELAPTVTMRIHAMDTKALNKAYKENDKQITELLELYQERYTTKANKAIYSLMVIGLRSELQNILTNLKFDKLENAIEQIKAVTAKYITIAGEGNQSIVSTLTKFIGAAEYLFINAAKIEYDYYVKKEQARQEQIAIREQMRQEAQERKELEAQKKKIEAEESKYHSEIEKIRQQLLEVSDAEKASYEARILELQSQLSDITVKKDTIVNLQNGKAGNIYVISNLGSFGENVFKIGMTRRLNPQERIDELGSASVPFKFDVHSFIFSKDAVSLEAMLHRRLNDKRVNKVNLRKEFFNATVDELEALVSEIDPTAEFNKTMAAEEYRQSISGEIYNTYSFDESAVEEIENIVEI